jgi:hypothetical protein
LRHERRHLNKKNITSSGISSGPSPNSPSPSTQRQNSDVSSQTQGMAIMSTTSATEYKPDHWRC